MRFNPLLAQRLAEERVKDALRKAEQARLIRAAKGPKKAREWLLPVALIPGSLLGLVIRQSGPTGAEVSAGQTSAECCESVVKIAGQTSSKCCAAEVCC